MKDAELDSGAKFGPKSFARYLANTYVVETYILMGDKGRGRTHWLKQIAKTIQRARELSRGTASIQWYLDGLGDVLSSFLPPELYVRVSLGTLIGDGGEEFETLYIEVIIDMDYINKSQVE